MRVKAMIRLVAPHDRNGNARRLYVALGETGAIARAWDEGVLGWAAVPPRLRKMAANAITFYVPAREYKNVLAQFGRES